VEDEDAEADDAAPPATEAIKPHIDSGNADFSSFFMINASLATLEAVA
jgi:hypothetical protein